MSESVLTLCSTSCFHILVFSSLGLQRAPQSKYCLYELSCNMLINLSSLCSRLICNVLVNVCSVSRLLGMEAAGMVMTLDITSSIVAMMVPDPEHLTTVAVPRHNAKARHLMFLYYLYTHSYFVVIP